jgi:hypothetical protein
MFSDGRGGRLGAGPFAVVAAKCDGASCRTKGPTGGEYGAPEWDSTPALDAVVGLGPAERVLLSCDSFLTCRIVFDGIGKLGIELLFVSLLPLVSFDNPVGGGKKL